MHDRFNLYKNLLKKITLRYMFKRTRSSNRQKIMCNFMYSVFKNFMVLMKFKGCRKMYVKLSGTKFREQ
jgi:hypothetical protein